MFVWTPFLLFLMVTDATGTSERSFSDAFQTHHVINDTISVNPDFCAHLAEENIFEICEEMPEFPGGIQAMNAFIQEHVRYPAVASEKKMEGTVVLEVVITHEGKICNIIVKKDIGGGCAKEAARVISLMPDWIPARQRGKPVNARIRIPFRFKL